MNILNTAKAEDFDEMIKRRGRRLISALEDIGCEPESLDEYAMGAWCLFGSHECKSGEFQASESFKRVANQVRKMATPFSG